MGISLINLVAGGGVGVVLFIVLFYIKFFDKGKTTKRRGN